MSVFRCTVRCPVPGPTDLHGRFHHGHHLQALVGGVADRLATAGERVVAWSRTLELGSLFPFSFTFYTVVFPNYQEDETLHREALENLGCSPSAGKHVRMVLAMEGLEGPNTQGKAERFMAETGHHLEEMMATYHPPGIAGKVAGKSSNT